VLELDDDALDELEEKLILELDELEYDHDEL